MYIQMQANTAACYRPPPWVVPYNVGVAGLHSMAPPACLSAATLDKGSCLHNAYKLQGVHTL